MSAALYLLLIQGVIGAFDTLFYHEWKARLVARPATSAVELRIHAARDFLYGVIFLSLPWVEWHGAWAWLLILVFLSEAVLTMWDFAIEKRVRARLGDVFPAERVTHNAMAIVYGLIIANLFPVFVDWVSMPTGLLLGAAPAPEAVRIGLTMLGLGVIGSGMRDLYAAAGGAGGAWPWRTGGGSPGPEAGAQQQ